MKATTTVKIEVCAVANYLPITELELHPENPRQISRGRMDELKLSILKKGFYEPILVWSKNNVVLAGNHRLQAARELIDEGYHFSSGKQKNKLPVVMEDCSDEIAHAILFETNNHYAEWVDERLRDALGDVPDLDGYGFKDDELKTLLAKVEKDTESTVVEEHTRKKSERSEKDGPEDEKHVALILPVSVHNRFMELLRLVAVQVNPKWDEGDSIAPAVTALCSYIDEYGVPDVTRFS